MPAVAQTASDAWDRVTGAAAKVEEVINWPVDDAAAVIGVDTVWLAGILLATKFLAAGLYKEFFAEPRRR